MQHRPTMQHRAPYYAHPAFALTTNTVRRHPPSRSCPSRANTQQPRGGFLFPDSFTVQLNRIHLRKLEGQAKQLGAQEQRITALECTISKQQQQFEAQQQQFEAQQQQLTAFMQQQTTNMQIQADRMAAMEQLIAEDIETAASNSAVLYSEASAFVTAVQSSVLEFQLAAMTDGVIVHIPCSDLAKRANERISHLFNCTKSIYSSLARAAISFAQRIEPPPGLHTETAPPSPPSEACDLPSSFSSPAPPAASTSHAPQSSPSAPRTPGML